MQTLAPNTTFDSRRTRSPTRSSASSHRSRSVSPVGLTIAPRQAQLAAHMASTATSGVGQVVATANATHSGAEQALATTTHTAGSIEGVVREHIQRLQEDTSRAVDDVIRHLATELTATTSGSVEQSELHTREMVDTL